MQILLPLLLTVASAHNVAGYDIPTFDSGYEVISSKDPEVIEALTSALRGGNYVQSIGGMSLCYTEITKVEAQTMHGIYYRYTTLGCTVQQTSGKCVKPCQATNLVLGLHQPLNISTAPDVQFVTFANTTEAPSRALTPAQTPTQVNPTQH